MRRISLAAIACAALVPAAALLAERPVTRAGPAVFHPAAPKSEAKTADLVLAAPRLPPAARHALGALPPQEKAALASGAGNPSLRPKRPAVRVGVSRELTPAVGFAAMPADAGVAAARVVGGGLLEPAPGGSVWTAAFSSTGAGALRLHFRAARLPQGSRAYVYSAAGEVHGPYAFDRELPPEGFWTNTVFADEVFLEVRLPAGARDAVLSVDAVVHLEHPSFAPPRTPAAASSRSARGRPAEVRRVLRGRELRLDLRLPETSPTRPTRSRSSRSWTPATPSCAPAGS